MNWTFMFHIANYEFKLLSRSWVFRVLALLTISGIFLFHLLTQSTYSVYSWSMVALASSIPLVNAFLLSLALSFVLIFTIMERLPKKTFDTLEVIFVRPESNLEYLTGKFLGIGYGFLGISLLGMGTAGCINLFASNAPFNFFLYLFYYFTWIIPSLAFITAFSFLIVLTIRHRFPALLFLLAFLYVTINHLSGIRWGAFDYLATNQDNIFSDIHGHVSLPAYLLHRLAYLLLAGSCLFFATRFFYLRTNNKPSANRLYNFAGLLFLITGMISLGARDFPFSQEQTARETYRSVYKKYDTRSHDLKIPVHDIILTRDKKHLHFSNRLVLQNDHTLAIPRCILYLNPHLQITRLTNNGNNIPFTRESQAIIIEQAIPPGDSLVLNIDYSGKIDERVCYLDIADKEYYNTTRKDDVYRFGRRYAYTDEQFTLLTPECLWYPVAIPPVNLSEPLMVHQDYTRFHLQVETAEGQIALSRGNSLREGNTWKFTSDKNPEGLSVCIGEYEKKSVQVRDFTILKNRQMNTWRNDQQQVSSPFHIELYYFKGHDFFASAFSHLDSMLTRETIEKQIGVGGAFLYPSNKLLIVETPLAFTSYFRINRRKSEYVQPEMLFYPEYGCCLPWLSDYNFLKKHYKGQQDITGLECQYLSSIVDHLNDIWIESENNPLVRSIFQTDKRKIEGNLLSSNPIFREPIGCIHSPRYPVLNLALKRLLKDGSATMSTYEHEEAKEYLATRSLKDAIEDTHLDPWLLNEIIKLKSFNLGNYIMAQGVTWADLSKFMENFYTRFPRETSFEEYNDDLKTTFNVDLSGYLHEWYTAKQLPVFLIKNVNNELIRTPERVRVKSSVKVYNPSSCGGFITLGDFYNQYTYYIPPATSKEIKLLLDGECQIHLGLSLNKPSMILPSRWGSSMKTAHNVTQDSICGVFDISPDEFKQEKDIIIVDNESSGFHLKGAGLGWIQRLWGRTEALRETRYIQAGITGWGKIITDAQYGDTIKSAFYKFCGNGKYEATWQANIPDSGRYKLYAYVVESMTQEINTHAKDTRYHYTIVHGNQKESVEIDMELQPREWFPIGEFDLPKGEVKVILSDKGTTPEHVVVADAIKWEKLEKKQILKQILKGKI